MEITGKSKFIFLSSVSKILFFSSMIKDRTNNAFKKKRLETGLSQSVKECQSEVLSRHKTFTKVSFNGNKYHVNRKKKLEFIFILSFFFLPSIIQMSTIERF